MKRIEPKLNLIQIQDRFVARINAAHARWQHRKGYEWQKDKIGGHYGRSYYAAWNEAQRLLAQWGFTCEQSRQILKDAYDMATLERSADE